MFAANKSDTVEGCRVFQEALERYPSLDAFSVDGDYQGTSMDFVREQPGTRLDISKTVKVQPKNPTMGISIL
ncbi:MAG: hypothetical protein HQM12_16930 [SAR324 cluster bacterium]|nr:hypothetical protein [SAR324 cluster bacterium]